MAYCWLKKRRGVWWLYYAKRLNLRPESLSTPDKALAKEVWRRRESGFFCNTHGIEQRPLERLHYRELVQRFLEHKKSVGLNEKTIHNYETLLNHLGDFLPGDLLIEHITTEQLEKFVIHRRESRPGAGIKEEDKRTLKPKSIRNEVFILIDLFHWAKKREYLAKDSTGNLTKPKRVVYDSPRYLTFDEYLKLKAKISNPVFADIVDFYLLTGIRRSDGQNVTSENFDFERMVVMLPQAKQGTHKTIPIGRDLLIVAKRMIERAGEGQPLVTLHPSRLTGNFAAARDAAGLPKSLTFHSLRHTFASWLVAAGTDIKTVQELAGHASMQSTQLYVHAFNPNKRTAIDKMILPKAKVEGVGLN